MAKYIATEFRAGLMGPGHVKKLNDGAGISDTAADLATAPSSPPFVRTSSHNLTSKLGAAIYKKVAVEPTHALWEPAAGGGYWELSEPRVNATMAGMIGNNSYDNGQALADAVGYAGDFGAEVFLPRGNYKVSATTAVNSPDKPPSIVGEGSNATFIEAAPGNYYALEFGDIEGLHLQGFRVRKPLGAEDYAGGGIYIHECHYGYTKDIMCWGFEVGWDLVNVLSTEFDRPLALYNMIGFRAGYNPSAPVGVISPPNALTIKSPIWGLNQTLGGQFDHPMNLLIEGGSIEGNGWGSGTGRGGLRINEGEAVALNMKGVQLERNKGDADLHIVAISAPHDSVFNIEGCSLVPIDNTNFVTNRILVELAKRVRLNLRGNRFTHYGSYTPSTSRKYIGTNNANLLKVDVAGDFSQFADPVEYPVGLGPMGVSYGLRVNADGSAAKLPSIGSWGVGHPSTGVYEVSLPTHMSGPDFSWTATTDTGDVGLYVERTFVGASSITVVTRSTSGALADSGFSLTGTPI